MQVRGQCGEHQIDGARTALGHAYGGGSQFYSPCGWSAPTSPDADNRARLTPVSGGQTCRERDRGTGLPMATSDVAMGNRPLFVIRTGSVLVAVLLIAGCTSRAQTDGPSSCGGPRSASLTALSSRGEPRWQVALRVDGGAVGVLGPTVVVATAPGIAGLDLAGGREVWRRRDLRGAVVLGTLKDRAWLEHDSRIVALDAQGHTRWTSETLAPAGEPATMSGSWLSLTGERELIALDPIDGATRRSCQRRRGRGCRRDTGHVCST